jgi:hypothetical protein
MKLLRYWEAFLESEVNLNQTRLDTLADRVRAITNYLEHGDHEMAGMFVQTIPQGSYAHGTIIKPVDDNDEFDADLLFEVTPDDTWEARDYVERLYKVFRASSTYKGMVSRGNRCVVVDYAGDFHLDVVPFMERHGEHFITRKRENEFELTNPTGFSAWLDEKNRITGRNLIKVIRLLKYLRDYKNTFSVKSFILSLLVGERVNELLLITDPNLYKDVPTTLRNVLLALNDYLQGHPQMPMLIDPSCTSQSFNHRWDEEEYENFRDKIEYYSGKIDDAYKEEDKTKSLELWQEVFGPEFKAPETKALSVKAAAPAVRDTEQLLDRDYNIPTVLDRRYQVRMVGRVVPRSGFRHYALPQRGNLVGKGRQLRFKLTHCTVPEPYDVYWKIKNYGGEAAAADCMRGEIRKDDGSRQWTERTQYRGRHYVECYVVKNGICVAANRQMVIIE